MTAIDTSTAAVTALMDGVTEGPWYLSSGHMQSNGQLYWQVETEHDAVVNNQFCWAQGDHAANARFIAAARQLVPALLAERDAALAGAVKVKPLVWEKLGERAWRAPSPFFGSFRVECYGGGPWQALWSVPGFCDTFVDGDFAGPDDAKQAIDARILAAIQPDPDARQADLAKAFCMGRDTCGNAMDDVADNWSCGHMPPHCDCARDIEQWRLASDECRALTPPADLAARIGGEE